MFRELNQLRNHTLLNQEPGQHCFAARFVNDVAKSSSSIDERTIEFVHSRSAERLSWALSADVVTTVRTRQCFGSNPTCKFFRANWWSKLNNFQLNTYDFFCFFPQKPHKQQVNNFPFDKLFRIEHKQIQMFKLLVNWTITSCVNLLCIYCYLFAHFTFLFTFYFGALVVTHSCVFGNK